VSNVLAATREQRGKRRGRPTWRAPLGRERRRVGGRRPRRGPTVFILRPA